MKLGCIIVLTLILAAIFAPLIAPHDPYSMELQKQYGKPSSENLMGLDQNGSDVFSRVLYGARISLTVAFTVVSITLVVGLIIGSIAGFNGGWTDTAFMRLIDMIHAFPGFLLALALVAVLGPSIQNLIIAMCITGWTGYARLVRAEVLHLKTREYVSGARSLGAGPVRVLMLHIWPNLLTPLLIQATFGMAGAILTESSLSFLGVRRASLGTNMGSAAQRRT